jgi:hypothetical protein
MRLINSLNLTGRDRQIGTIGIPEDAVDVSCRLLKLLGAILSVGDQTG